MNCIMSYIVRSESTSYSDKKYRLQFTLEIIYEFQDCNIHLLLKDKD